MTYKRAGGMIGLGLGLLLALSLFKQQQFLFVTAQTTTHYVTTDRLCGEAAPCYDNIQTAVDAAASGDIIKIAAGSYSTNQSSLSEIVLIDKSLTIIGGYDGVDWDLSVPLINLTELDAQNEPNRRVITINGSSEIEVSLSGLQILGGAMDGFDLKGGGIYMTDGKLTLNNNVFSNNIANSGGALYVENGSLTVENNRFSENEATLVGGAVWSHADSFSIADSDFHSNIAPDMAALFIDGSGVLSNNVFEGNRSTRGSTIEIGRSLPASELNRVTIERNFLRNNDVVTGVIRAIAGDVLIKENLFTNNRGSTGGALSVQFRANVDLISNSFLDNVANEAGAIDVSTDGVVQITNNTFEGNSAERGGALYLRKGIVKLEKNIFRQNLGRAFGGAIYVDEADVSSENDMIINNESKVGGVFLKSGSFVSRHLTLSGNGKFGIVNDTGFGEIRNSIIADHDFFSYPAPNMRFDSTLFHDNDPCDDPMCTNNLTGDPRFVDPINNDFHLLAGSAAIDQGGDAGTAFDIDGEARPSGEGFDLGADEFSCGFSIDSLKVSNATNVDGALVANLEWISPSNSGTIEIRYADSVITEQSWDDATTLASNLPLDATSFNVVIPYSGETVYFALRYQLSCGQSPLSMNGFWPTNDIYLGIIEN